MKTLAARNGGPAGLAALLAILLLGFALRADYAWEGERPVYDAVAYGRIADNLDAGRGFTLGERATQPASNYSPGLPLLISALYKASGGVHERFARLVLAAVGALAVLFAYLIGRRLSGTAAGLVAAAAVAIFPALLEYQGMLMSEPLAATLLSGSILAIIWAGDPYANHSARGFCRGKRGALRAGHGPSSTPLSPRHPRERWLVPGLLLGALTLTRPEYLGVAVLLALVVFVGGARDEWRTTLARAAVMLAGLALVVAPWTIRNAVALDRFVPVSTGGGQVLFTGAYIPSDGDPERVGEEVLERHPGLTRRLAAKYVPALQGSSMAAQREALLGRVRLEQILAALAEQRYPSIETDRALSRMGRERLWDNVSEEPLAYTGFLARKMARVWSPGPRDVMHEPVWRLLHWALVVLGLLGLAVLVLRGRRQEALLLATVFLAITAISVLLVASPRRVLVMVPLLAAVAGVSTVWLASQAAARGGSARPRG